LAWRQDTDSQVIANTVTGAVEWLNG
jgi:hypothetical protein